MQARAAGSRPRTSSCCCRRSPAKISSSKRSRSRSRLPAATTARRTATRRRRSRRSPRPHRRSHRPSSNQWPAMWRPRPRSRRLDCMFQRNRCAVMFVLMSYRHLGFLILLCAVFFACSGDFKAPANLGGGTRLPLSLDSSFCVLLVSILDCRPTHWYALLCRLDSRYRSQEEGDWSEQGQGGRRLAGQASEGYV